LSSIYTAALALVAFAAGAELRLATLRDIPQRLATFRIAAGAIAVPFAVVTFVVLTVSPWFPLTAHQPFRDAVAVALVLGTLAAVSSPVLVWAVMSDAGDAAHGPLSRTILGVAVAQDVVAVVLLTLMLGLAQLLASAGSVTPGIAGAAFAQLGGSVAAGVLLGVAIAQYIKVIRRRLVLLLIAVAFLVVQAVRLVGLDAVLIALAAGCSLENLFPLESERLKSELKRCALPIYVVLFALAGADLRLDALGEVWPWALLLVGLRITSLRAGLRWAGRHPAVSANLVTYAWLGLVSQGGLALTLAAILRRAFTELNMSMESLLVAMIGMQMLAGPVCFHWALRRSGEVTEEVHDTEEPVLVPGSRGV
jgi:Kef-type K+ transport system membrane component KefB